MSRRVASHGVSGISDGCEVILARLAEPIVTLRLVVVAAHPDDETIGAGALLARSTDASVILVTDGAPRERSMWPPGLAAGTRESYAQVRRDEIRLAMADAGLGVERLHLLNVADGDATDQIPYVVSRLVRLFDDIMPDVVVTHAYEGGHIDHDATALAVHLAMAAGGRGRPVEMALYHGRGPRIVVHEFLPGGPTDYAMPLDARLRDVKGKMLARYVSQQHYDAYFGTDLERYRCAPTYDFTDSPNSDGQLLYERANASLSGAQWRVRARAAIVQMEATPAQPSASTPDSPQDERTECPTSLIASPERPLVSVIVRTIGRKTLTDTLNSVAAQTYQRIEIVLADVGGKGAPAAWHGRDGLVTVVQPAHGLDRPTAGNIGLATATGDFVAFLDDDDWFHPEHLASLVAALDRAPDVGLAYAGVEVVEWPDGDAPRRRFVFDFPYDPTALLCQNYIPINALVFRRDLVKEGCKFDVDLPVYEDWDLLIQLSRRTRFLKVPGIGAVYRWPPGSAVSDPVRTADTQAQIYAKWRGLLSLEEHVALMRRATVQIEVDRERTAGLRELERHLAAQDDELARLRPCVADQDRQLDRLRSHLKRQDAELSQLRPSLADQGRQMDVLRSLLEQQAQELTSAREMAAARAAGTREAEAHLAALLASWSWRLTRPLRSIADYFTGGSLRH